MIDFTDETRPVRLAPKLMIDQPFGIPTNPDWSSTMVKIEPGSATLMSPALLEKMKKAIIKNGWYGP